MKSASDRGDDRANFKIEKKKETSFFTDRTPPKKLCWDRESGIEAERSVIREAIKTLK